MRRSARLMLGVLGVAAFIVVVVWSAVYAEDRRRLLTVSFLDVGQGDAIFIDAPSGRQVLIDGGKGAETLRALAAVIPWYDRSIDLIVATHPDADHIGGLVDVLARYRVDTIVESGVRDEGSDARALESALVEEGVDRVVARRGQIIQLGGGARIEVLFPDRSLPDIESNTGSIVARIVYGDTSFLLSGDSPDEVEEYLVALERNRVRVDVLKVGHHGSKTSSSPLLLGYTDPAYAILSRGCDNSYGHPAPEVVERLRNFGISTLDTCIDGTITFVSDGTVVMRQ